MDAGVMVKGVSTKMASTPTQDSAFLRLPLEIRCEIYKQLIHIENTKFLSMVKTPDPASGLRPVTNLLGVSQQIRTEVHDLIAAVTAVQMEACETRYRTAMLHYVSYRTIHKFLAKLYDDIEGAREFCGTGSSKAARDTLAKMIEDEKRAPHQLKFWKVCVPVGKFFEKANYVADIDFRAGTVRVYNPLGGESSNNSNHWPTKKEAFTDGMRFFIDKDGFDGITIADMSTFLEKVALRLGQAVPQ